MAAFFINLLNDVINVLVKEEVIKEFIREWEENITSFAKKQVSKLLRQDTYRASGCRKTWLHQSDSQHTVYNQYLSPRITFTRKDDWLQHNIKRSKLSLSTILQYVCIFSQENTIQTLHGASLSKLIEGIFSNNNIIEAHRRQQTTNCCPKYE